VVYLVQTVVSFLISIFHTVVYSDMVVRCGEIYNDDPVANLVMIESVGGIILKNDQHLMKLRPRV